MASKLTWYGHATWGLETGGYRLLIDPFFSGNPAAVTTADQVQADYLLVTHGHSDHIGDAVAISKRTGAVVISNSEICRWLSKQGVKVHSQHIGGGCQHPFGYLKLTLALHGSGLPDGSYGGNPAGFLLTLQDGKKLYFAGDTGLFGDMALIGEEGLYLAVLPIGDNYTMGPVDALRAVRMLNPRIVIPMHYDTWENIKQDVDDWCLQVNQMTYTQAQNLKPGESLSI
jgi:L-ascorbate metabolism protein UlaG (beta-lactamase superfamily)